jgi:PAS domain S-box-containing protein
MEERPRTPSAADVSSPVDSSGNAAERSRARIAFLAEASRILANSLDYEVTLRRIAELAVPRLADWCAVDIVADPDAGRWPPELRRVAVTGIDPDVLAWARATGTPVERDWDASVGLVAVLRTRRSAFYPRVSDELLDSLPLSETERTAYRRIGLRSAISVALVARDRLLGCILFGMGASKRTYDRADLALAEDLAHRAAVAIDNARLYAAERAARVASERAAGRLQRLQSITSALANAMTPAEVAGVVVDQGLAALGATSAAVALLNEPRTALEVVRAGGASAPLLEKYRVMPLEAAFPLADAARDGVPVILSDAAEREARYPHLEDLRRINGGGAMAALPLLVDGRAIGAIGFNFPDSQPIVADDHAVLIALASQCAQALERARLYEAEIKARELAASARSREMRVLETISDAFVAVDREWRCTYVNRMAARLAGREATDLIGRVVWNFVPEQVDSPLARTLREVMDRRHPAQGEEYSRALGAWIEYRVFPSNEGLSMFFRDVTERRQAEERTRFLSEASRLLSSSLDHATTLANVARLAVPALANTCIIDLVGTNGTLDRVATAFESLELNDAVQTLRERYPIHLRSRHPVREVLDRGETLFFPSLTPEMLDSIVDERPESQELVRKLAPTSCVFVALKARDRTLGVMSLSTTGHRKRFDNLDRALIEELAQRVGMAVDNARLHEAERLARAEAEAANQAKSDFLAVMSHELRTPLTAVVGYTELLADEVVGPINETQHDHLMRVKASSEHLLMLIEDILSFSRIEAGREVLYLESSPLARLMEHVATIVRPLAEKKGLRFELEVPGGSAVMTSDPQKVRQILINLLANAIKFTDEGYVRLKATVDDDVVQFAVEDSGPGIAGEHLERVFEAFWQVDQRMTRRAGGTGLGLSVARQLARLLGGEVTPSSAPGKGSTFTATLPLRLLSPPEAPNEAQ